MQPLLCDFAVFCFAILWHFALQFCGNSLNLYVLAYGKIENLGNFLYFCTERIRIRKTVISIKG